MTSTHYKLLDSNSQLGLKNGIYQNMFELFRESSLSNYIRIAVSEVFDSAASKSLFSLDIENALNTEQLKQSLSADQFSFLRALDLDKVHTVLDISEDFGGVAHYLADQVGWVESVKIDPDRARLATNRCANKKNVCHISENLDKLVLPNAHYDLIVLGQLEALELSHEELTALLPTLCAALSEHGVLLINTLNQSRIAKQFNVDSADPQQRLAFSDLYATSTKVFDIERKTLRDVLHNANFAAVDFHASFGHGQQCANLFSEDYLTASVNVLNHFYRLGSLGNSQVNEYLFYQNLCQQKHNLTDCANRFIVLAGVSNKHTRRVYDNDFSHFPGTGRQPHWRATTARKRSAANVNKIAAYPVPTTESPLIAQDLSDQPFLKGRLLVGDWLTSICNQDSQQFAKLIERYSDWLNDAQTQDNLGGRPFKDVAYDALPFNIVVNERSEEYELIDTEWRLKTQLSADFVLFRALFWFAFENKTLLKPFAEANDIHSIALFVLQYMPNTHQIAELDSFAVLEEQIQAEIDNHYRANAVRHALLQSFDESLQVEQTNLRAEVAWGNNDGQIDEANTVSIEWTQDADAQALVFEIPSYAADMPVLRVDPSSIRGTFAFNEITINDVRGDALWSLSSSEAIAHSSDAFNVAHSDDHFVALNDDPYFLFDLGKVDNIESAKTISLTLRWHWGAGYSEVVDTLSAAVASQNTALVAQSNRLNQYRADREFQAQRIEDLLGHRADLNEMLAAEEKNKARLRNELAHLEARLHQQTVRNDELHGYLLMRPSTRAKRVAARTLNRLTGNTEDEVELDSEVPEAAEPSEHDLATDGLIGQNYEDYDQWVSENTLNDAQIEAAKVAIEEMPSKPVFSILVPVYNTDPEYLIPMIRSVQAQIYPHWQLCLVDDCSPKGYLKSILEYEAAQDSRISIQLNDVNQGISVTTNDALEMATGDYIALLDHDDELSIDALYENAKIINQMPDAGLIYSDEDKMDLQGNRLEPYFKPDYSPDLLDTNNYICHFTVIKKSIADEIGGFREGLDGSQDHDIILRAVEAAERVVHIPKILYHWRKIPGSTAVEYDSKSYAWEAGRKAVEDRLAKKEGDVRVEFGSLKGTYRVFRKIQGEPLVSIVIPFKDKPELLDACLNSILNRSSYSNIEIIGVSNNSEQELTFERMEHFKNADSRVRFVEKNIPFNFSAICNYGVEQANGEYVVLLNNDIEIISTDWIERLLEHAQRPEVGAVGGKLLYPDGRIQHAGVVVGMVGAAGHPHKFFPDQHIGYHGRLHMVYNVSAVTGAMMMINTDKFLQAGGFDEDNLAVAYNDIDLCLKLMDLGLINLFTPHAKATHHESISRGYEDTDEKLQRLLTEQDYFLDKWSEFIAAGDPYYNPNLSLKSERFSLNFKD